MKAGVQIATHAIGDAGNREDESGVIAAGKWADLTVMDVDPFATAEDNPADILNGNILMTIVNGGVVYER